MHIMARVGRDVLNALGDDEFIQCLHSVGYPLDKGQEDVPWPCDVENRYIVHFRGVLSGPTVAVTVVMLC